MELVNNPEGFLCAHILASTKLQIESTIEVGSAVICIVPRSFRGLAVCISILW